MQGLATAILIFIVGALSYAAYLVIKSATKPKATAPQITPQMATYSAEPRSILESPKEYHWNNNPTAYDWPKQAHLWPRSKKPIIGYLPDPELYDTERMYKPVEEIDWGLFWNPIPDPMGISRGVFFPEDPVSSGLRARIVETSMSGKNPMCGRGGYPGF